VWKESLQANAWLPSFISGDDFAKFVEDEHSRLRDMLIKVGLL
jgi:putative tricarboxylic transport membrane protein